MAACALWAHVSRCISVLGRGMFAMARTTWQVYVSSYALMPLGSALGIPVMTIAVKRYSNKENRSHAFGMFYTVRVACQHAWSHHHPDTPARGATYR